MYINEYAHKFIQKLSLKSQNSKILLAVSGGLDSMVMLHVINKLDLEIGVATVNYNLRPYSIEEVKLVVSFCIENNILHHIYACNELERKAMKSSNLQEKARDIRFTFFDKLCKQHDFTHIMMAHHRDDNIESLFLALNRGSGLDGLSVMSEVRASILRPFLSFSKEELKEYAHQNAVGFKEDATNLTNDYDRNFVRNSVMPIIKNRFPSFTKSTQQSISNIQDSQKLLKALIEEKSGEMVDVKEDVIKVNIKKIESISGRRTLLFHFLKPYGFNAYQCSEILLSNVTGALWHSSSHSATLHQDWLIINLKSKLYLNEIVISKHGIFNLANENRFSLKRVKKARFEKSKNVEYVDGDLLKFPLTLRVWRPGDKMKPIGLNGQSKKVKDLLTDAKINRLNKQKCLVLCSENEIVWLVNIRLDERYKVTEQTTTFVKLEYHF